MRGALVYYRGELAKALPNSVAGDSHGNWRIRVSGDDTERALHNAAYLLRRVSISEQFSRYQQQVIAFLHARVFVGVGDRW